MSEQVRLTVVPVTQREANAYVQRWHRHHGPVRGSKFQVAVADPAGVIRGVAIVGRPVSRVLDDGWTLEVLRVTTEGVPNGCSILYGACWRAARCLGYRKLITYTLKTEPGTSLKAAGWKIVGEVTARSWNCPSRPRVDINPAQAKLRWEVSI